MNTPDTNRDFYTREICDMLQTTPSDKLSYIYYFVRALNGKQQPLPDTLNSVSADLNRHFTHPYPDANCLAGR